MLKAYRRDIDGLRSIAIIFHRSGISRLSEYRCEGCRRAAYADGRLAFFDHHLTVTTSIKLKDRFTPFFDAVKRNMEH